MFGGFFHYNRVAQIWLIGAVFAHGNIIGNAREGLRNGLALGIFFKDFANDRLNGG